MNEAIRIIDMLVGLIYDLYPDEEYEEEYEELYGIKDKIEQAQQFVDKQAQGV